MIFNLSSGGGTSLNYKIVGGTAAPSSPTENMIWVNTSIVFEDHIFSATEPESPISNMVWIYTGMSSVVSFSVTKENPVMVYPIVAKQYVDNEWTTVQAKSYQDGAWVSWWDGTLYSAGDECTSITGGWESAWTSGSFYTTKGTLTKNSDSMTVSTSGTTQSIFAKTVNKIDISGYTTLTVTASAAKGKFGLSTGDAWNVGDDMLASANPANGEATLDISTVEDGEYYICMYIAGGNAVRYSEVKLS